MPQALQGTFHSYHAIGKLGAGAFGEVTLARVVELGAVVALKRIPLRATDGLPDNVVREMRCLQALQHPNVVRLLDVFAKGQALYLVQEYCVADLGGLLRRACAPLGEALCKGLLVQMLRGLQACHSAGIMHRDVKPSNVLVSHTGSVKLADMGLARPLTVIDRPGPGPSPAAQAGVDTSGSASTSAAAAGKQQEQQQERPSYTHTVATRWYRAPELLYGARQYDEAVDVWGVGVTWAEVLGLSPLLPGENDIDQLGRVIAAFGSIEHQWPGVQHLPDWGKVSFPLSRPKPLEQLLPGQPPGALALLAGMLRYDPEQRLTAQQALREPYLIQHLPAPAGEDAVAAWVRSVTEPTAVTGPWGDALSVPDALW